VTTTIAAGVWRLGTDQLSATMKAHPMLRATQYFLSELFTSFVYPINATKQCLFANMGRNLHQALAVRSAGTMRMALGRKLQLHCGAVHRMVAAIREAPISWLVEMV
jgi:hypothetical protein